jgi:hypothetical protein
VQEAITPVVQVVTSGPDWPAIAAAIAGAVVGLAGIIAGYWQSKRSGEDAARNLKNSLNATARNLRISINAENKRAWVAEKRRIYAECLAAFEELTTASIEYESTHPKDDRTLALSYLSRNVITCTRK